MSAVFTDSQKPESETGGGGVEAEEGKGAEDEGGVLTAVYLFKLK